MAESNIAPFIECTSLNFSYDTMGLVTVSYTMVHKEKEFKYITTLDAGKRTFTGYVTSVSMSNIPNSKWYETQVSLIATTED
jgi:hypothetical protein